MSFIDEVQARRPERPICHYTSLAGFLGILHSKTIWASKIQYLNDEKDFTYAADITSNYVDGLRAGLPDGERSILERMKQYLGTIRNLNVYVASFSERDDLLSQWRGYCPPGKGINIGFTVMQLEGPLSQQPFHLVPCVYDGKEQSRIVQELVEDILAKFRSRPTEHLDRLMGYFGLRFASVAPILKHEAWSEEAEWRLVSNALSIRDPNIRCREGRATLIPYYDFRLADADGQLTLGPIRLGPTPHFELAMSALADALTVAGARYSEIRKSFVPFRSW